LVEARGPYSSLRAEIRGSPSPANPKTSAIVGSSVLSALTNGAATIQFV
jgi:predicted dinucleotide-utilizing enzyme